MTREQFNVWFVGLLAIGCFVGGVWMWSTGYAGSMVTGSLIRLGLILGALWLALPTKGRAAAWANLSPWWIAGIAAGLFFILRHPRALLPVVIAAAGLIGTLNLLTGRFRR